MNKTELEEKIKNGESVWGLFGGAYEIKLSEHSEQFFDRDNNYCYTDKNGEKHCCFLQLLYKTKAEAEHYLHHANVTRTETLPFLTWEEFKIKKSLRFKRANDFIFCEMSIFKNQIYIVGHIEKFECFGEATEANFYKAYDECVRLFKQGE